MRGPLPQAGRLSRRLRSPAALLAAVLVHVEENFVPVARPGGAIVYRRRPPRADP